MSEIVDDIFPYVVSVLMVGYGSLLLHHCNTLIRDKMDPDSDLSKGTKDCKLSEDILLEQGIAIVLITLGVLSFSSTMYARHPDFFHATVFFSRSKDSDNGGHPFIKFIYMMITLAITIYILIDYNKHKQCIQAGGGVGGDKLFMTSTLVIVAVISIFFLYKGIIIYNQVSMSKKPRKTPKGKNNVTMNPLFKGKN